MARSYGLNWIDENELFSTLQHCLQNPLGLRKQKLNPPDPFTVLIQTMLTDVTLSEALDFEEQRVVNKRISNAVGSIHQNVLALSPNWQSLGNAGGVVDLETIPGYVHPRFGKPIVAEVKNRFNTVKASDESKVWDQIDQTARNRGAQGYLFQITPHSAVRYDNLWSPTGRPPKHTVRICDGVTAYELVFGEKTALQQLYFALPEILSDLMQEMNKPRTAKTPQDQELDKLFSSVYSA